MDLYAQNILDRYKTPFYKDKVLESTKPENPNSKVITRQEANHSCGDTVEIQLKLKEGKVSDYSFTGSGCAISMASADLLGDLMENLSESEVLKLDFKELKEVLGIPISLRRSKCALLPLLAVQNGLLEHQGKPLKEWTEYRI